MKQSRLPLRKKWNYSVPLAKQTTNYKLLKFLNFFQTKNPVPEGAGFFGNAKEEIETKGKYEKENKNS